MEIHELIKTLENIEITIAGIRQRLSDDRAVDLPVIDKMLDEKTCLYCKKPIDSGRTLRGTHEACYRKLSRQIEKGVGTWTDALEAGLVAPQGKSGPKTNMSPLEEYLATKSKPLEDHASEIAAKVSEAKPKKKATKTKAIKQPRGTSTKKTGK